MTKIPIVKSFPSLAAKVRWEALSVSCKENCSKLPLKDEEEEQNEDAVAAWETNGAVLSQLDDIFTRAEQHCSTVPHHTHDTLPPAGLGSAVQL